MAYSAVEKKNAGGGRRIGKKGNERKLNFRDIERVGEDDWDVEERRSERGGEEETVLALIGHATATGFLLRPLRHPIALPEFWKPTGTFHPLILPYRDHDDSMETRLHVG